MTEAEKSALTVSAAAASVCSPTADPAVQIVDASPSGPVSTEAGSADPPPAVTVKVTVAPPMGSPAELCTRTVGAMGRAFAPRPI